MTDFQDTWYRQMQSLFKKVDGLFTSANNAGTDLLNMGFKRQVTFVNEIGQVPVPSMAISLEEFPSIQVLFLLGDHLQLRPQDLARMFNEFSNQSQLPVLEWLDKKGFPITRLNIQYRMAPEISQWPGKYFYNGELKDHDKVSKDNACRQKFRDTVKKLTGWKTGSEYFIVDQVNAMSFVQPNSTSLVNWSSASSITRFADELMNRGILPNQITILIYYAGQKEIIVIKLRDRRCWQGQRRW